MRAERAGRSAGSAAIRARITRISARTRRSPRRVRSPSAYHPVDERTTDSVRHQAVPEGARPLPHRRHDRHRMGRRRAGRVHDRVVHVGVARPAARRVPPPDRQRHLGGDGPGRQLLRQRPARRPGRPVLAIRQDRHRRRPLRRRHLAHRRPDARSSRASGRGSTARSSTRSRSATTTSWSAGWSTSTTTRSRTCRWSSTRGPSAASSSE